MKRLVNQRLFRIDDVIGVQYIEIKIGTPEGIATAVAAGDESPQRCDFRLRCIGQDCISNLFLESLLDLIPK